MKTQDQLLQMPVCRGSKHSQRQPLSLTKARLDLEHVPNGRRVFVGCYSGGLILSLTLATFGCISVLQKQQKKKIATPTGLGGHTELYLVLISVATCIKRLFLIFKYPQFASNSDKLVKVSHF